MHDANREYVCVFIRAERDRLACVERLVIALPSLVGPALDEVDLGYRAASRSLVLLIRVAPVPAAEAEAIGARLRFWCARYGGRATALRGMTEVDRRGVYGSFEVCELKRKGATPGTLFEAIEPFFSEAGAAPDRPRSVGNRLIVRVDVGGQGWEGVRYRAEERALFVPAPIAPAVGDALQLAFRIPGVDWPIEARGTVTHVRSSDEAVPGEPAGYTVILEAPPRALHDALSRHAPWAGTRGTRIAPRYPVAVPVKVIPATTGSAANMPRARIEYETDQELAMDYTVNLSNRGAFVRTANPAPAGSQIGLDLRLPNGTELHAPATVVYADAQGMGVQFALDPESQEILAAAISHIAVRARRALVVDDDALVRRMLADALRQRGFEVLTAPDGMTGLRTLADEVLALDLVVTDLRMPELDGEAFVRTIRGPGGETDLAIVAVTGSMEEGLEPRLAQLGADAVLDKALGAEVIAQAADAVLERKRLALQAVA